MDIIIRHTAKHSGYFSCRQGTVVGPQGRNRRKIRLPGFKARRNPAGTGVRYVVPHLLEAEQMA
jgi:hypothetical protein